MYYICVTFYDGIAHQLCQTEPRGFLFNNEEERTIWRIEMQKLRDALPSNWFVMN